MKKFVFYFLILLVYNQSIAQGERSIAIAPMFMNVFYVGIDNPVEIAVFGLKPEDITVSITNGTIKKTAVTGRYIVRVNKQGVAAVTIHKGDRSLGSKKFRCKLVPDPYACLRIGSGDLQGGNIKKVVLLNTPGVSTNIDFGIDISFNVASFTVSSVIKGKSVSAKSNSGRFTTAQKMIIKETSVGSEINIEDIRCIGPDGAKRKLNSIVLKIQ